MGAAFFSQLGAAELVNPPLDLTNLEKMRQKIISGNYNSLFFVGSLGNKSFRNLTSAKHY